MLARNSDIDGVVNSMRHLEDRFNRRRRYPWIFLNEKPFDDNFKRFVTLHFLPLYTPLTHEYISRRVKLMTQSDVQFGLVQQDQWVQPKWINDTLAEEGRNKMSEYGFVPYASKSFLHLYSATVC
jgi:alpha 1,2-mannosyltransferase